MPPSPSPILADLDIEHLASQDLLRDGPTRGFVKLHRSLLPGDVSMSTPEDSAPDYVVLPTHFESLETLLFLGFGPERAKAIFDDYEDWPDDSPIDVPFVEFVLGHVVPPNIEDAYAGDGDDKWAECLESCGMSTAFAESILDPDPRLRMIRDTQSCLYWVHDTVQMKMEGLLQIQRASSKRAKQGRHRPHLHLHLKPKPKPPQDQNRHRPDDLWTRTTAAQLAKAEGSGKLVLFKAVDSVRLVDFWPSEHNIRIGRLLSRPPTSFGGTHSMFYFSADPRVAESCAAYAKRRAGDFLVSISILCAIIDKDAVERLFADDGKAHKLFYPDPHWRQLVYFSRVSPQGRPPEPLRKYRNALLQIGHTPKAARTARRVDLAVQDQDQDQDQETETEPWEEVGEESLLRVPVDGSSGINTDNDNIAIQYVFSGSDEGQDFLVENTTFESYVVADTSLLV